MPPPSPARSPPGNRPATPVPSRSTGVLPPPMPASSSNASTHQSRSGDVLVRFRDGLDGGPGHGDGGVPAQVRQRGDDAGGEGETGGGEDISAIAAVFVRGGKPPPARHTTHRLGRSNSPNDALVRREGEGTARAPQHPGRERSFEDGKRSPRTL